MSNSQQKVFGIIGNPQKEKVWEILPKLLDWFQENNQQVLVAKEFESTVTQSMKRIHTIEPGELASNVDLILALGGDGTILHTARLVGPAETPILGVRLGGLGFLAEVYIDEIYDRMYRLIDGNYHVEKRMTIAAEVHRHNEIHHYFALNDFVINKSRPLRMLKNIRVTVDGGYLNTYSADGLIVSSPTGSTAYSLSVQGPIVIPTLDAMVINPISPHSLTARPVVISSESRVTIEFEQELDDLIMSADGQIEVDIDHESIIHVTRGKHSINLLVWRERTFFDVLRRKMQWGKDPRNHER